MMALITMLFVGAAAWRKGGDRATCILNQRTMQMGVRGFQNMYGYSNGGQVNGENLPEALLTREFINQHLFDCATGASTCPDGGTYSVTDPARFPDDGEIYMTCSFAETRGHVPEDSSDW